MQVLFYCKNLLLFKKHSLIYGMQGTMNAFIYVCLISHLLYRKTRKCVCRCPCITVSARWVAVWSWLFMASHQFILPGVMMDMPTWRPYRKRSMMPCIFFKTMKQFSDQHFGHLLFVMPVVFCLMLLAKKKEIRFNLFTQVYVRLWNSNYVYRHARSA